jgi:hypothetical protein
MLMQNALGIRDPSVWLALEHLSGIIVRKLAYRLPY